MFPITTRQVRFQSIKKSTNLTGMKKPGNEKIILMFIQQQTAHQVNKQKKKSDSSETERTISRKIHNNQSTTHHFKTSKGPTKATESSQYTNSK